MADQPGRDDDDAAPSEVTVPPWLRTGPVRDQSDVESVLEPAPDSVSESSPRTGDGRDAADPARIDPEGKGPSREVSPNRIRLGGEGGPDAPDDVTRGRRARDLTSLRLGAVGRPASDGPVSDPAVSDRLKSASPARAGRTRRVALFAAAGVAVLSGSAVLGFVLTRGILSPGEDPTACAPVSDPGHVVGSGPGSLDTPLETVLAFDHAYYAERSAEKAFEAVSPSSRMTLDQLRADGVDRVPEGTTHCVDARELSPTLLEVTLTESPPDSEPVVMRQRVRLAENPDGTWGIVSITPAG
ncbi:hypothetical protein CEY15_01975 [Dietzia natronolimnaea]|uniref:DUF8176 domain-containing protein n=1 Tax=Dietzia natronolimnaea TaxID=161920 RepID=A0A2A2WU78_9ACTN|nr:hypothetical protein [Dietzia natronolimnaea]PAY24593.1 hypothetical protein CEY15_01975 [Dietzia natronolimnaea]